MLNSLAGMSIPCFLMLYELVSMLQNVTAWPLREKKKKKKRCGCFIMKIHCLLENILPIFFYRNDHTSMKAKKRVKPIYPSRP